jgi:hypothetical protein
MMQAEPGGPRVTRLAMHRIEDRSQNRPVSYAAILGFFRKGWNPIGPQGVSYPEPDRAPGPGAALFAKTGAHFFRIML